LWRVFWNNDAVHPGVQREGILSELFWRLTDWHGWNEPPLNFQNHSDSLWFTHFLQDSDDLSEAATDELLQMLTHVSHCYFLLCRGIAEKRKQISKHLHKLLAQ
jgi:hypothetical protein